MKKYNDILFHYGNCLNHKKPFSRKCTLCIQNCPHGAINELREINLEKCTECGICTAICPSDGFVYRDMKSFYRYLFYSQEIILNCPLAEALGYEIPCLGMLDSDAWTTLLIQTNNMEIKILTGDCTNCYDKKAGLASKRILEEINQRWPKHPTIKIEDLPVKGNSSESLNVNPLKISDSEKRVGLREQGREKLKMLFPAIAAEETYDIPTTRQWLKEALEQDFEKRVPYYGLVAGDDCTGCGICVKICPQNALTQIPKDSTNLLIYEPLKCVQCSRCVETCGPKALRFDYLSFSYKFLTGRILLIESLVTYCKACGKQLFFRNENELCTVCASKPNASSWSC